MQPDQDTAEAMLRQYQEEDEGARLLRSGHGRLELVRTRELLGRFLPGAPGRVLDVGGGTGVHASRLADRGYQVHLVDPVPRHIDTAAGYGTFTVAQGDARNLDEPDRSVDAVLLLGPLNHLVSAADRLLALREALRVLRRGGVVFAAAIGRCMAQLAAAVLCARLTEQDPALLPGCAHLLAIGRCD